MKPLLYVHLALCRERLRAVFGATLVQVPSPGFLIFKKVIIINVSPGIVIKFK